MTTHPIALTVEEIAFIINAIPLHARYPEPYDEWAMKLLPEKVPGGGPEFRLKMLAVRQHAKKAARMDLTYPVEFTVGDLWFLDAVMSTLNYAQVTMPNNTPMLVLAEKVWNALIDAHANIVDERYLPTTNVKATGLGMTDDQKARLAEFDKMMGASE